MAISDVQHISLQPMYAPLSADVAEAAMRYAALQSGARTGAQYAAQAARGQVAYQTQMARCRTQCAPRPVLWQEHCRNLCMQGKVMPCIANEPWPPCVAARSIKGFGQMPEPLGVPLWGWGLGLAGVAAAIWLISR